VSYSETRRKGVASFVRATRRDAYWSVLAEQRAGFLGPAGELRSDLVEDVHCVVCGPAEFRPVFVKDAFPYVRCRSCGSLFIRRQLRDEVLDEYWSHSPVTAMWLEVLFSPSQLEFDRKKFGDALVALEQERGGAGTLLDVGASVGTFLDVARARGWTVHGVEPGERARELARSRYGLELDAKLSDVLDTFDVVSFWEVVEHTKRPQELLAGAVERLSPGGTVLSLVGGNAASLANRIMRDASAAFDFARLWYFTPASFARLLAAVGLEQLRTTSMLAEMDTAVNYLRYDDPYDPSFDDDVLSSDVLSALTAAAVQEDRGYKFLSVAVRSST
jgi:SAM-dependent methyltransferase